MQFDDEHRFLVNSINENEAQACIHFLTQEEEKHSKSIAVNYELISQLSPESEYDRTLIKLYESAIDRDKEDLYDLDLKRTKVKRQFGWL